MYEVLMQEGEEYEDHYVYKSKNKCNQIIVCEIWRTFKGEINFSFYITSKRKKGYQDQQITGRDGICSLVWAKKCLLDFIEFGKRQFHGDTLVVYPDDLKRRIAYEYALLPLGFKIQKDKYKSLYIKLE